MNTFSNSSALHTNEYVILLHGLGRTRFSMNNLKKHLTQQGYHVINIGYPSTKYTIQDIAEKYVKTTLAKKCLDKNKKINFVTHSMGGVIVRYFLANQHIENLGRVVMLAPPNHGGEAADTWSAYTITRMIMGPALSEMTTAANSFVNTLPLPNYEVGIIAGDCDKKVSAEKTKLKTMKDFILVPSNHTWIIRNKRATTAVIHFLTQGNF